MMGRPWYEILDSYYLHQNMLKISGGMPPKKYGESLKRSKKKTKRIKRGK